MRVVLLLPFALVPAFAGPVAVWHFGDGAAGQTAERLAAEGQPALHGQAGFETVGVPPTYDADVPGPAIWDGATLRPAGDGNQTALRFTHAGLAAQRAPQGSVVLIDGAGAALRCRR